MEVERLFLAFMIAHHEGGVDTAEAIVGRSTNRAVLDLADSIVKALSIEITLIWKMLGARG